MVWQTPNLHTTGDLITVSVWNSEVIQNISYLGSSHAHLGKDGDGGDLGLIVPTGMIGIFTTSCPSGWTRVTAFDDVLLMGSTNYGVTAGSSSHAHSQRVDSPIFTYSSTEADATHITLLTFDESPTGILQIKRSFDRGGPEDPDYAYGFIGTYSESSGIGSTSETFPPYIDVIFCKKD